MTVKQISVFIENRPGAISAFANILRENGIDMRALSLADVQDYGILRVIVDNVYVTSTVLKNAGYVFRITPVIAVPLEDQSGCLADVLDVLGRNDINVEYDGKKQDPIELFARYNANIMTIAEISGNFTDFGTHIHSAVGIRVIIEQTVIII